jgi:hypothetical protein
MITQERQDKPPPIRTCVRIDLSLHKLVGMSRAKMQFAVRGPH